MATFRTLNEIRTLDRSNHTLRFNRNMRDAGIRGPIDDGEFLTQGFASMVAVGVLLVLGAAGGALVLWGYLTLVLGQ